jgi:hypothetical protein
MKTRESRITVAEMKFMRKRALYTSFDYERNLFSHDEETETTEYHGIY